MEEKTMKQEDLQKLKYILEGEIKEKPLNSQMFKINIRDYIPIFQVCESNKDKIIDQAYKLWEKENINKTNYRKMIVKNQIIEYVKGTGRNYQLMLWYFKDNQTPFYIDIKKTDDLKTINNQNLQAIINDYDCDYHVLKEQISEVEAIKLKKQIVYYYHVLGLPLLNHKEMK